MEDRHSKSITSRSAMSDLSGNLCRWLQEAVENRHCRCLNYFNLVVSSNNCQQA